MGFARPFLNAGLAAALGASLLACGGVSGASNVPTDQTLTVYSSEPLQGGGSARSRDIINGEKLALAEAGGHIGPYRVSYVSMDDSDPTTGAWTPGQASAAARTAAQDKSTIAYLGDWDSGATAVSLPIINGAGILQVSPASTYVGLTGSSFAGKGEPDRYYPSGRRSFGRLMPSDQVQAAAAVGYLRGLNVRRIYLIRDRDAFDADLAALVSARAAPARIKVLADETMSANVADDVSLASRARHSGAGAVLYAGAPTARAARLLRQLASRSPALKLLCPYYAAQADFLRALGPARQATYVTTPAQGPSPLPPGLAAFQSAYHATFNGAPGPYAAYGYESMRLVLDLIRSLGSRGNDRQALVRRFFAIRNRDSVIGRYSVRPSGDTTSSRYGGARPRGARLIFDRPLTS